MAFFFIIIVKLFSSVSEPLSASNIIVNYEEHVKIAFQALFFNAG